MRDLSDSLILNVSKKPVLLGGNCNNDGLMFE